MFRLVSLSFDGGKRWDAGKHPHEAPATMTVPLVILAALSAAGGVFGIPASLGGGNAIEHWLEPVFARATETIGLVPHDVNPLEYVLMVLSVAVAVGGIFLAREWYLRKTEMPKRAIAAAPAVYGLLWNKYYVDDVYDAVVVTPTVKGSEKLLWRIVDVGIIDWLVNAVAKSLGTLSSAVRVVQSGIAQSYVFIFVIGVVALLGWLISR
jgi:NADH-quinone oxidoreductase subunit L